MTGSRRAAVAATALLLATAVGGCMPTPATTQANAISDLYTVFAIGGIIVAAIVWSLTTWSILRYRHRDGRQPPQTQGGLLIETIWTGIPIATVLALFVLTVITLGSIDAVEPGGVNIRVLAFRWQWQVQYSDAGVTDIGTSEAPLQLVLPVNTPVHVTLESLDVDHAFFIPAFLFQRDAIPGRVNTFDIQITKAGIYPGSCAEFCGLGHDEMLFSVRAVDMATYQAWLASRVAGASASPSGSAGAAGSASPAASATPAASALPAPSASTAPVPASQGGSTAP